VFKKKKKFAEKIIHPDMALLKLSEKSGWFQC
jgi:hypothetical protein